MSDTLINQIALIVASLAILAIPIGAALLFYGAVGLAKTIMERRSGG